jgi:hypothetical protein
MNRKLLVGLGGFAVTAIAAYIGVMLFGGKSRTIERMLQKYEFTELSPPSLLAPPGTLVTVKMEHPLVVAVVCPASESLGEQLADKLLNSTSSSSKEAEELTGSFRLGSENQTQLAGAADSKFVKRISLTLSDVRLIELPDSAVFQLIAQRKSDCWQALEFRKRQNAKVSMIKAVIQANVVYRVEFDGNLDTRQKARITKGIAGNLGLNLREQSDDSIQGTGLFWGVRDDESLASVSLSHPPVTGGEVHPRLLGVDRPATVAVEAHESQ